MLETMIEKTTRQCLVQHELRCKLTCLVKICICHLFLDLKTLGNLIRSIYVNLSFSYNQLF